MSSFLALAVKANTLISGLAETPENSFTFPAAGTTFGDALLRDSYNEFFVFGPGVYQQ